jgi:hypothetical protein
MKSNSDVRPTIIQDLGNGAYYYNYNIAPITTTDPDGTERTGYECNTVKVWGRPTYEAVVKAVIRDEIDETAEFDLVNAYNAAAEGILEDAAATTAKDAYIAYLRRLQVIKQQVKADMQAAGY